MTGIAELFESYSGRHEYEMQLELWAWRAAAASAERLKTWTAANPERARASKAVRQARWRAKRPITQCYRCIQACVPGKRACATHLEFDRVRAAARYAAKHPA